jgi:hypothetical protein
LEILQTVVIKQILTEKSKQELFEYFSGQILQLKKECEQLRFERKRMESNKKSNHSTLHSFNEEIQARVEKIKMLEFRMEQLHILPLGSEIKHKEIQAITNVEIGDVWDAKDKVIVIKDGIVVHIQ